MDCKSCNRPTKTTSPMKKNVVNIDSINDTCLNKMSDGRAFTDYKPQCVTNLSTLNSFDHRMYLTHNASNMMKFNLDKSKSCNCFDFNVDGTMLPELNKTHCDKNKCTDLPNNTNGIGIGRK